MKTYTPKKDDINQKWYLVDAKGKTLGRLATQVATVLRGKHKPTFTPHMITGDFVVVINAKEIQVTGDKKAQKMYRTHSGYLGGLKETPLEAKLADEPEFVIKHAVAGMIPRNKLKKEILSHLKIYAGSEHEHTAQKPEPLDI